jgi:hypothetical protein
VSSGQSQVTTFGWYFRHFPGNTLCQAVVETKDGFAMSGFFDVDRGREGVVDLVRAERLGRERISVGEFTFDESVEGV